MALYTWHSHVNLSILIDDCKFYGGNSSSDGGGFAFIGSVRSMTIINSEFHSNFAMRGGGLFVEDTFRPVNLFLTLGSLGLSTHHVTIASTTFDKNDMLTPAQREYNCTVLYLEKVKNITIMDSTFSDNNCTCILMKRSIFHAQGIVGFYRNRGYDGGALAFQDNHP